MGVSGFSSSLFVVGLILVLSDGGYGGTAEDEQRFITRSDLTVRRAGPLLTLKSRDNATTIIVVDKNGRGDSDTVQGAVDMVPTPNKQRVKIHIRPGIYRSEKEKRKFSLPTLGLFFFCSSFHFLKKKGKKLRFVFFNLFTSKYFFR